MRSGEQRDPHSCLQVCQSLRAPKSVSLLSQCYRGLINIADLPFPNMTILNGSFTVDFAPFLNQFTLQNTILPSRKKKKRGNECAGSSLRELETQLESAQWLYERFRPHSPSGRASWREQGAWKTVQCALDQRAGWPWGKSLPCRGEMAHFTLVRIEMMVASIPYTAQLEIIEHNESASQRLPLPAPPQKEKCT